MYDLNMPTKIKYECNNERTKFSFTCRKQNARENYNLNIGSKPFECVTKSKICGNDTNKTRLHA
jgi:hypothetical protein